MSTEEINDILEELHLVRPEILQPKAKKLFTAIMIIADERDKYKSAIDKVINKLDIIIYDLEEFEEEASPVSIKELCEMFNILKEASK